MMATPYGGTAARLSYLSSANDSLLDELTQQLATVRRHNRRLSRASSTQNQGGAMRIVKPRSAHNSPGSSELQGRRRAVLDDGQYRPSAPRPLDENMYMASQPLNLGGPTRPGRPISWHPPSRFVQQPENQVLLQPQTQCQMPTAQYPVYSFADADYFMGNRQLPPTPAVYSGYTSPASAFSPLSLPTTAFEQQPPQYFPHASWATMPDLSPPAPRPAPMADGLPRSSTGSDSYVEGTPAATVDSWGSFALHGFNSCTAPPTPEDFVQVPQAQPKLQPEETIPYQPLEDQEEEQGEILYGMGLYDTPEKPIDAHLDYHRSTVSSLLGGTFTCPEPTGKGLKLEDAWEPPASEDGESEEVDDDAEGDAQDSD